MKFFKKLFSKKRDIEKMRETENIDGLIDAFAHPSSTVGENASLAISYMLDADSNKVKGKVIATITPQRIQVLRNSLDHESVLVRYIATNFLGLTSGADDIDLIIKKLDDEDGMVRIGAADVLASLRDMRGHIPLTLALGKAQDRKSTGEVDEIARIELALTELREALGLSQ